MELTAGFMLSLALKSTAALALSTALAAAFYRTSAAVRHLVWAATMVSLLFLPFLGGLLPEWRAPAPAVLLVTDPTALMVTSAAPAERPFPVAGILWSVWAAGCVLLLTRTLTALVRVRRALSGARPLKCWGEDVFVSEDSSMPAVCGFWKPKIVVPSAALSWTPARFRMVLGHERMHIARHDTRTQVLGRLACAMYWPNPLVWYAAVRLRREAEQACDDGVLEQGERPSEYAGELIQMVQGLQGVGQRLQGGLAMVHVSELESRLKAMLKGGASRKKATAWLVTGACLLSLAVLLPLAALRAPAQQSGGIAGVVRDASGANVSRARVTAALNGTNRKELTSTDEAGRFSLQPLPDGTYSVTVSKSAFAAYTLQGVQVKDGQPAELVVVLNIGALAETLTVQSSAAQAGGFVAPPPPAEFQAGPPSQPVHSSEPAAMPSVSRIRVGGNVQSARLLQMVNPAYPPDCKAEGVEGAVLLDAAIATDGFVKSLARVNELVDPRLVQAAIDAVKQWRYQPTLLNGQPVEVLTTIEINFALQ
jgi:TonB family protein